LALVPFGTFSKCEDLTAPKMLRYTDIEEAIRLARLQGMSTIRIVRALTGSVPHSEALEIAQKAAPILGLSVKAFMELRRNR
jgi:hypothetical protein